MPYWRLVWDNRLAISESNKMTETTETAARPGIRFPRWTFAAITAGVLWLSGPQQLYRIGQEWMGHTEQVPEQPQPEPRNANLVDYIKNPQKYAFTPDDIAAHKAITEFFRIVSSVVTGQPIPAPVFAMRPEDYLASAVDFTEFGKIVPNGKVSASLSAVSKNVITAWQKLPGSKRIEDDATLQKLLVPAIQQGLQSKISDIKFGTQVLLGVLTIRDTGLRKTKTGETLARLQDQLINGDMPAKPAGTPKRKAHTQLTK